MAWSRKCHRRRARPRTSAAKDRSLRSQFEFKIRHPSQKEGILACDRTLQIANRRHQPPIVSIVCLAKACKDSPASPGISSESLPSKRSCNNDIWLTVSKGKEHHGNIEYFPSRNGVLCWVLLYQAGGPR